MSYFADRLRKLLFKLRGFEGNLDGLQGKDLVGWCYNRQKPDCVLDVGLVHKGKVVARVPANKFKHYLMHYGVRSGAIAFQLRVPDDMLEHVRAGNDHVYVIDNVHGSRRASRLPGLPRDIEYPVYNSAGHIPRFSDDKDLQYLEDRIAMSHEELARELAELRLIFRQREKEMDELRQLIKSKRREQT